MRNLNTETGFFVENRKRLSNLLKPDSIAIINSNDVLPSNADGTMKFIQNSDLFYLTGILQEETILVLLPGNKEKHEVLFIRDYNPELEVWEGKKLSPEMASEISGVENVMPLSHFEHYLNDSMKHSDNVYLNSNEHDRAKNITEDRDLRFARELVKKFPLFNYRRLAPLLYGLRVIKQPFEVEQTRKACELSDKGFRRILSFVKPGVFEYEVEAEFAHEFISNAGGFADYSPIIASGENACFLHYVKNDSVCNDGDLLLLDVAAGWSLYNSDMTRTIPVNGRFTKRQKNVYNSVLRAFKGTASEMKPGITLKDLQYVTRELIGKELVDLGLINVDDIKDISVKSPALKKYYPHDVSHFLGLAVHDVGDFNDNLRPGMILTCEPGIYIREERLGVRIENDILITENGNIDLMSSSPIEVDEIEVLMNERN